MLWLLVDKKRIKLQKAKARLVSLPVPGFKRKLPMVKTVMQPEGYWSGAKFSGIDRLIVLFQQFPSARQTGEREHEVLFP
jgi:hypothetical protein